MEARAYFVTGGAGFIGAAVVNKLLLQGNKVTVFDNCSRGRAERLNLDHPNLTFHQGDVRNQNDIDSAISGCDSIIHLAYINGTEFFYQKPDLILDVGIRGMLAILDAGEKAGIRDFVLASSSEVYQDPGIYPTPEEVELRVPDVQNPRYSYGGGKIACELLLLNRPAKLYDRRCIFRPHNIFGPDMGAEHVVPQLIAKVVAAERLSKRGGRLGVVEIQGDGSQQRSFMFIDDFVEAIAQILDHGKDKEVFHVGTKEEMSIIDLLKLIQEQLGVKQDVVQGELPRGGVMRRCPDITKLQGLGFSPRYTVETALPKVLAWYAGDITK